MGTVTTTTGHSLVNQEARAITGCFRTTDLGVLAMGVWAQNRQRPGQEVVGAASGIGKKTAGVRTWVGTCSARTESTALLEEPATPRRRYPAAGGRG